MHPANPLKTLYAKLAGAQVVLFFALGVAFLLAADRMVEGRSFLELVTDLLIAAILFSLLAGLLIFRVLTRRLRKLIDAIARFRASGFAEPIRLDSANASGDDIDVLGDAVQEMSERIAQQLALLALTDVRRRELLANVSHDLRTPLASMQGYVETLLLRHGTMSLDEERSYLQIAAKHSERLGKLIRDLFQLTKLEAHEVTPQLESFPVGELGQDVLQKFELLAGKRGVRLDYRLPQENIQVRADIGMIESTLENLIENAIRHTPAGGLVMLDICAMKGRVLLKVSDTGAGIPPDELPSIFDRYYHVDRGEVSDIGRTGLGLAISRHVIELHGGTIAVESTLGKGTTFSFDLAPTPP
jgi:signal transduction histidine kinase